MSERTLVAVPDKAIPPANLLREELEYRASIGRGLTILGLAVGMGWSPADAQALVDGRTPMTQAAADALGRALGTDAGLWMHLQHAYEADLARLSAFTRDRSEPL